MRGEEDLAVLTQYLSGVDSVAGPVLARRLCFGQREVPDCEYIEALQAFSRKCAALANLIDKQALVR